MALKSKLNLLVTDIALWERRHLSLLISSCLPLKSTPCGRSAEYLLPINGSINNNKIHYNCFDKWLTVTSSFKTSVPYISLEFNGK